MQDGAVSWVLASPLLVCLATFLAGQPEQGRLVGTVSDVAGGLPGVTVSLISTSLDGPRQMVTGPDGKYDFPSLPPGTYTVTYELGGFKTLKREPITITPGITITADAQLEVGDASVEVTVTGTAPVLEMVTPQGTRLYAVDYSYQFSEGTTVRIEGLGVLPAKGNLRYFTSDPQVQFRDPVSGRLLAVFRRPVQYQKAAPQIADLPSESAFSDAIREEPWSYTSPFARVAMDALAQTLRAQYYPYEKNGIYYLMSTYASVPDLPRNLRVQIAFLVSHPYAAQGGGTAFRVQSAARERRLREDKWRDRLGEDAQRACSSMIDKFVEDVIHRGQRQQ